MAVNDAPQSPASGGSRDRSTITQLAEEIVHQMQRQRVAPSLALFVECLGDVADRIPDTFDEQIALLKEVRESAGTDLKKAGKLSFMEDLAAFTAGLDRCGEMPAFTLELVVSRVQQMDPFAASRYLEGIGRLSKKARKKGPERSLLALLGEIDDQNLPFAWSDWEWRLFGELVKRQEAVVTGLLAPETIVREKGEAGRYRSRASADEEEWDDLFQLPWTGSQVDLVFWVFVLIEIGMLDDVKTTDKLIARLFKYETNAQHPAANLKSFRYKLGQKDSHPSRNAMRQAIRILTERLSAADQAALDEDSEE